MFKCHVAIHIIFFGQFPYPTFLFDVAVMSLFLPMFGATGKYPQLVLNTFFILLIHTSTMIVRKNFGVVLINSCGPFHSLK